MNKKELLFYYCQKTLYKYKLFMKITTLLTILTTLQISAAVYSQNKQVNINEKNISLLQIFNVIESQSEFRIFYKIDQIDLDKRFDLEATNTSISDILNNVLKESNASYKLMGKIIVITPLNAAQQIKVSGTVVDATTKEPLPGVNITVEGTTLGAVSDVEGKYSLTVPQSNSVLLFSFVGYNSERVQLSSQTELNITMVPDIKNLEEVVVVGYGTMKKKDLTGSVTRIDAEKISKTGPTSIGDIIRTGAPGLSVGADNSAAGEGGALLIRGQRSLAANNAPLLVVDGIIFYGSLYELNKNDIESVDILKDASSAAVYGSKSANGVVIITTKNGKSAKPIVNFNLNLASVTRANDRKVYDAEGFLKFRSDLFNSINGFSATLPGKYMQPTQENLQKYGITIDQWRAYGGSSSLTGTDGDMDIWLQRIGLYQQERDNYFAGNIFNWYDNSFQTGLRQDYNVSISGKSERVNYYFSLGALDSEGIIKENEYGQYTANLKLTGDITKFLEVGINANYSNRTNSDLQTNWGGQIINNSPYSSYTDADGNLVARPNGASALNTGQNDDYNRQFKQLSSDYNYLNTSLFAKVKLPFNVTYEVTFAPRLGWFKYRYFESGDNILTTHEGLAERTSQDWYDWQIDNILRWDHTFGNKHHVNITLLQNSEEHFANYEKSTAQKFNPSDVLGWHNMKAGTERDISTNDTHSTGDALMGRLFYSFDNRYMITASIRQDGYSAFGKANPRAAFPSVALAWAFSNESFLKWAPLSMGKLRVSWGENGNRDIGIYTALANLEAGTSYIYATPSGTTYERLLFWQNRMANYDLKWERTSSVNVGLDLGFLNNRINGSIEYYYMPTKDLLVSQTLPLLGGFDNVTTNLGEVLNSGIEITLNTVNLQTKYFTWSTSVGLSHNKNEIKHLFYTYDENGNENDVPDKGWFIGKEISTIWNYKFIGIWQESEATEAAKYGQRPGDPKALDVNTDYKYDNTDKVFMGQTAPKVRWSMRNDFNYRNFDFSVNLYSYLGHKETSTEYMNNRGANTDRTNSYDQPYWTPENPSNEYGRLWSAGPSGISPVKALSKNFVRIDNIALSYSLPKQICKKIASENVRFTGSVNNAFVFSNWDYWDPEISGPMPRTFTIGANVTF
jgi:TonB-linked SusC/RagA family outer membrane protein